MKKMFLSLALLVTGFPFLAHSQTVTGDFQKGSIMKTTHETLEGSIKDQTKKGTIVFTSTTGQKKVYTPDELLGFTLNGANYISYLSDFYKVVVSGSRASLYQRVTDNSGKMLYNGADAISITTASGKIGDFYLQAGTEIKLTWLAQKNFDKVLATAFTDCTTIVAGIKAKQWDYSQLNIVVSEYNACK